MDLCGCWNRAARARPRGRRPRRARLRDGDAARDGRARGADDRLPRARRHVPGRAGRERAAAGRHATRAAACRCPATRRSRSIPRRARALADHVGHELVTATGRRSSAPTTRPAIAEIVAAVAYLERHPEIPHGRIRVASTPTRRSAQGPITSTSSASAPPRPTPSTARPRGEIEGESFNALQAIVDVPRRSTHTGTAKGEARERRSHARGDFVASLPPELSPETTEGREGFVHPQEVAGGRGEGALRPHPARPRRGEARRATRRCVRAARRGGGGAATRGAGRGRLEGAVPEHEGVHRPRPARGRGGRGGLPPRGLSSRRPDRSAAARTAHACRRRACPRRTSSRAATTTTRAASGSASQDMGAAAAVVVHLAQVWAERAGS